MKDDCVENQVSDWNLWLQTQNQMFLGWVDDGESKGKNWLFNYIWKVWIWNSMNSKAEGKF